MSEYIDFEYIFQNICKKIIISINYYGKDSKRNLTKSILSKYLLFFNTYIYFVIVSFQIDRTSFMSLLLLNQPYI